MNIKKQEYYNFLKKRLNNSSYGTERYRLRRKLIYYYLTKLHNTILCYRCNNPITSVEELSYDHKHVWLNETNDYELFTSLDNISYSHRKCNSLHRRNKISNEKIIIPKWYNKELNLLSNKILYSTLKSLNLINCYRCNKCIESYEQLSIEHKKDWIYSEDPLKYFHDLNNITFSHLKCNVGSSNHNLINKSLSRIKQPNDYTGLIGVVKNRKSINKKNVNKYIIELKFLNNRLPVKSSNDKYELALLVDEYIINIAKSYNIDVNYYKLTNKSKGLL